MGTQIGREKYSLEEILIKDSPITQKVLRGYIERHQIIPYKCDICGCDGKWQNGEISLELDHKDGDNTNNEISNLHYLCPNCHALTETYRGRNKGSQPITIVTDEDFIEALSTTPNIRQALIKLGLSPAGANYSRAKTILEQNQIIQK